MKFPSLSLLSISQIGALFAAGGGVVEGKMYDQNDLTFKDDESFRYIHRNKAGVTFDLGGCDYVDEKPTKRCKKKIGGVVVAEKCQASCKKYLKKKLKPSLEGERLHVGCDAYVFKSNIQCDIFGENDPDLCMIQMVIVGQLSPEGTTIANGFAFDSYPEYDDDINDLDGETACMSTGVFSLDRVKDRDLEPIPLISAGAGCSAMGLPTPPDYQFVVKGRMGRDGTTIDLSFSDDFGFTYYSDLFVPDAPYLYKASAYTGDDSTRRELAGESLYFSAPACYVTGPGVDADICQREVLTTLDFTKATLVENSLHLPDQSGALVYANIGQLRGEAIDLVVRQAPNSKPYSTSKPDQNGYHSDDPNQKFGNVNVQTIDPSDPDYSDEEKELMDGQVELEFCFHYAGTDQKAKVDTFSFVLFDLDNRRTGLQEKITIDTSQASRFFVERDTEVKMWCEGDDPSTAVSTGTFQYIDEEDGEELEGNYYATLLCPGNTIFHATTHGTGNDNPNDPTDLNQKQLSRAVEFRFDNTECWTLKFEHYCPCVDDGDDDNYCGQPGAPSLCESNKWCPKPGNKNFNPDFPNRCRSYSGGNLVFAGGADERLADVCEVPVPDPIDCDEPEVSTDIDFSKAELIENTLHYEDQSGRLRYKNIGESRNRELDLVVRQTPGSSPYTTIVPQKNGYNLELGGAGPKFGNVNVQTIDPKDGRYSDKDKELMNGEVELEFCFYYTGTEEKARPDSFIFTLYDLDLRDGGVQERLTVDTYTAERFYVNEVNEVRMWCEDQDPSSAVEGQTHQYSEGQGEPFGVDIQTYDAVQCPPGVKTIFQSTTVGVESDNPQDPSVGLNEQQMARSIEFRFKNTQCWTIKYEHFCPCEDDDDEEDFCAQPGGPDCTSWCPRWKRGRCKWYSGANLVFAGKSEAQLNPVCP